MKRVSRSLVLQYSNQSLSDQQKKELTATLTSKYGHSNYTVVYEVEPTILGGLQVYFGNTYLDCSLASRIQKIRQEVQTISF